MPYDFHFGTDSSVSLDLRSGVLTAAYDGPRGHPIDNVGAAVAASLARPLDFPPLSESVIPGDKVVLALDHGLPQVATIVATVVEALEEAHLRPEDITLLRSMADVEAGIGDPRRELPPAVRSQVNLDTHDPADRSHLSYLAAAQDATPIYLNRWLGEADFVIPIMRLRLDHKLGYPTEASGLFATYSDSQAVGRFRSPNSLESAAHRRRLEHDAEHVNWLLGVTFMIGVVPGAGAEVLHIVGGENGAVVRQGTEYCTAAWTFTVPQKANFVLAGISGGQSEQTWDNVGRALAAALRIVSEDGSIALCTELSAHPGPAMQRIAGADELWQARKQIGKERPVDALAATELLDALERVRVYLLSRVDANVVEALGIAPVAGPTEIARLAVRQSSCILLANAQNILVTAADEAPAHARQA